MAESVAERAEKLFKRLEQHKRFEELDKAVEAWASINERIDARFPQTANIAAMVSEDYSIFFARERLRKEIYDRELKPYETLIDN